MFVFWLACFLLVCCVDLFGSGPVWSGVLLLATVILLVFLVWEFTAVNSVGGYSLVVGVSSGSLVPLKRGYRVPR